MYFDDNLFFKKVFIELVFSIFISKLCCFGILLVNIYSHSRQGGTVGWFWNVFPCQLGTRQTSSYQPQNKKCSHLPSNPSHTPQMPHGGVFAGQIGFHRNNRRVHPHPPAMALETQIEGRKLLCQSSGSCPLINVTQQYLAQSAPILRLLVP